MTLTIGIVNYNTKEDLEFCLQSIFKNPPHFNYSIIVVDNNSKDSSKEFLKNLNHKNIIKVYNTVNNGLGSACNQIAKLAETTYILFLNPDVIVKKDSIDRLVSFMKESKEVAIVTGKLLNPDGTLQLSCRKFPTILYALFGRESIFRKLFPNNPISKKYMLYDLDYNKVQYPDWVRGAVLLVKCNLFKEIGGFDERFFLYLEDTDLCLRFRKIGYDIAYNPEAIFYHKLGSSTKKKELHSKLMHNISMYYYIKKHMNYNPVLLFFISIALFLRLTLLFGVEIIKRMKK
jgi:GT2 family glycosyltransferase